MTSALNDGDKRGRHHLLTLAGPNIVYCSHSAPSWPSTLLRGSAGACYASRGPKTADGQASFRSLALLAVTRMDEFTPPLSISIACFAWTAAPG